MFLLDSSSLCWCLALTALCCLGRHIRSKSCFLLTVPDLEESMRNSQDTAWGYRSYSSKPTVNIKWGRTAQNLWLTCKINHWASPGLWQQTNQRSHPGKDSSPWAFSQSWYTVYIHSGTTVLYLTKWRYIAQCSLKITDQDSRLVCLGSFRAPTAQIPAVTNNYTEFTKTDSPDQNNRFLGRNKDWDFQWST